MKKILIAAFMFVVLISTCIAQDYNPVASPGSVVKTDQARFTVLTDGLIRMEWSDKNEFEDNASLVFVNRNLPVPVFSKEEIGGWLIIRTEIFEMKYRLSTGKFTDENLKVDFKIGGVSKEWTISTSNNGNLKGTARTLDGYDGAFRGDSKEEIDLGTGIISRDGWVLIDDSSKPLFDNSEWPWVMERPAGSRQDLYFFCYGHDYKKALKDYVSVAGKIPIPPKFAFGTWWSRYWEYSDLELRDLVDEFKTHDVPLDVFVVDMDWHITSMPEWYQDGKLIRDQAGQRSGWTGFTWNKNYFPDPQNFLKWTESKDLKVCLNLHPASGIQPHEIQYQDMARAMGIDPSTKKYVPFDIVNKKFAKNFLDIVLHPMMKDGIDFWWLDWQQWSTTNIEGVNPTFYLNYVFFSDMQRMNKSRPLIFHRYGGLGNHRYEIGFSGDTYITWASLNYQPYFTSTAANVGYSYWSHDIGGHMRGCSDGEMYARWLQFGAFSPILRTHATKSPCIERRIWAYPLEYFVPMREAYQMRYSMIPYIYTQARKAFDTGISICRPMYYEYPENENAYAFPNEYMFGEDMIIDPVTRAIGNDSLYVSKKIWLPEGQWYEWYTGSLIEGGKTVERSYTLDDIPLFVKAGSIIPMQPKMNSTAEKPVDPLILNIIPGSTGKVSVYEDAGNDNNYLKEQYAFTNVEWNKVGEKSVVTINPVEGRYDGMLKKRSYEIRLHLTIPPKEVKINGKKIKYERNLVPGSWTYNGDGFQTIVLIPETQIEKKVTVEIISTQETGKILSGKKGLADRLIKFMKFLADNNWDKSKYSNDIIVNAAQLMNRLTEDPVNVKESVVRFEKNYVEILEMINVNLQDHKNYMPYYDLLKVSAKAD